MDAGSRVEAYQRLFNAARLTSSRWEEYLLPDIERARYTLGTSVADRILPYALEDDVLKVFRAAFSELAYLYVARNRSLIGDEAYDAFLLSVKDSTVPLRAASYRAPEGLQNQVMRRAMFYAPRYLLGLDSGVLASWWGSGGKGRNLLVAWSNLLSQAVTETDASRSDESTPYLLHWVLLEAYRESGAVLDAFKLTTNARRELHSALLLGVHLSHHVVWAQLIANPKLADKIDDTLRIQWNAVCNPRITFMSAPQTLEICRFYPVRLDVLGSRIEALAGVLAQSGYQAAQQALEGYLRQDPELNLVVQRYLFRQRVSEQMFQVLSAGVAEGTDVHRFCTDQLRTPRAIEATFEDKRRRKEAQKMLESAPARPEASGPLAGLVDLLQNYNPKQPVKKVLSDLEVSKNSIQAILADTGDILTGRVASEALRRFSRRTGKESDRSIADEYEAGRLYRFGLGVKSFLKTYQRTAEVGHYFIDVKDYTRRTSLLKEEVMADFIRREFYDPILAIGREFYRGLPQLSDRGGLYLNNLLGDAVSFSGDIVALVNIARSIRGHLDSYSQSLSRRLDQADLARKVAAIQERFDSTRIRLEALGPKGKDEITRLEATRDEALGKIKGENLVAGSFIAFGASPQVVTFEDPIWGAVQVSIAEKINESARGTERSGSVLASTMALLQIQRQRTNKPNLELPFRVYVANTMSLPLPPEAELALKHAFAQNNQEKAIEIFGHVARNHVESTLAGGREAVENYMIQGMTLYNSGDALSGEALRSYRQARTGELEFHDRTIRVSELGPEILNRFGFSQPDLHLVVGLSPFGTDPEMFRYAGTVVFKGFERDAPTEIWEMINPEDSFGKLLSKSAAVVFGGPAAF